jgi:hypothetical protein
MLGALGKAFGRTGYTGGRAMGQSARAFARTPTGMGMIGGAGVGGMYGAVSDDTSIIGGMMGGAALGALGGRYGAAGSRRAGLGYRGIGVGGDKTVTGIRGAMAGFGRGIRTKGRMDIANLQRGAKGISMTANRGLGRIRSSLKNWK